MIHSMSTEIEHKFAIKTAEFGIDMEGKPRGFYKNKKDKSSHSIAANEIDCITCNKHSNTQRTKRLCKLICHKR